MNFIGYFLLELHKFERILMIVVIVLFFCTDFLPQITQIITNFKLSISVTDKFSPDSSGNPFLFFFKKEKIATDSWKLLQKNN